MTTVDYIRKIDDKIAMLKSGSVLKIAVLSVNLLRTKRIFQDGLNSSGFKIGSYNSTNPVYISAEDAPKSVKLGGKPQLVKGRQTKKKSSISFTTNKDKAKTAYFPSYKAFRVAMGRESSFVNLRLNNDLQGDLANASISKSSIAIATPHPIKITNNKYIVSLKKDANIKKAAMLEKKFGQFLNHTVVEKQTYDNVVKLETDKIIFG